jgi:antitoxin ParD1/3/4
MVFSLQMQSRPKVSSGTAKHLSPSYLLSNDGSTDGQIGHFWQKQRENLILVRFWCIFASIHFTMARQSISFTKPNDEWLKEQVENEEYSSKSELINDLIRQARKQQIQIDWIRAKLERSEKSGFTEDTREEILSQSRSLLNG